MDGLCFFFNPDSLTSYFSTSPSCSRLTGLGEKNDKNLDVSMYSWSSWRCPIVRWSDIDKLIHDDCARAMLIAMTNAFKSTKRQKHKHTLDTFTMCTCFYLGRSRRSCLCREPPKNRRSENWRIKIIRFFFFFLSFSLSRFLYFRRLIRNIRDAPSAE